MSNPNSVVQQPTGLALLGLSALGVVFGDIGTSPLYTLKVVMTLSGGRPDSATVLGLLSLLFWTLIIVTSVKYVFFAMKIDNNGEGGILALMAMLGVKRKKAALVVVAGLFGAALLYGDGAITPAISVLSALEGLNIILPQAKHFVLPTTVAILFVLFIFQPKGTARIGKTFGPIMAVWFVTIALLGIRGIVQHPSVLLALNPLYGMEFILANGYTSFMVLGGIFLCVTGAEALYADMGHFGVRPIRIMWFWMVFPCLLLNYAGQAALVLAGADISENFFYRLCPPPLMITLVILATIATIIASQAIITGAFSLTRQAILLGWLPRLRIKQTSAEGYGQIYVNTVNWLLMVATISLVLLFRSSDNLAAAYGIAVSLTMLLTSILLFIAMRHIWNWPLWASALVAGLFLVIDSSFVIANMTKLLNGGYIPLLMATVIFLIMLIWHRGISRVAAKVSERLLPATDFLAKVSALNLPRVPGTAIFLTRTLLETPPVMRWHVRRNHALHENLFVLSIVVDTIPWVEAKDRLEVSEIAPRFWRAKAHYGFMEKPNIPELLRQAMRQQKLTLDLDDATYYLGHEIIVTQESNPWYIRWQTRLFALLVRNSTHVTDVFQLPRDQVVEIGRQVAL